MHRLQRAKSFVCALSVFSCLLLFMHHYQKGKCKLHQGCTSGNGCVYKTKHKRGCRVRKTVCESKQVSFVRVHPAQRTPLLNYFKKGREWQGQQFLLLCCTVSSQPTVRHDTTSASAMLIYIELKDEAPHLLLGVFSPPVSHSLWQSD